MDKETLIYLLIICGPMLPVGSFMYAIAHYKRLKGITKGLFDSECYVLGTIFWPFGLGAIVCKYFGVLIANKVLDGEKNRAKELEQMKEWDSIAAQVIARKI